MKIIFVLLACALAMGEQLREAAPEKKGIELPLTHRAQSMEELYAAAKVLSRNTQKAEGKPQLEDDSPVYSPRLLGEYFVTAYVGTPLQTVNLMLDGQSTVRFTLQSGIIVHMDGHEQMHDLRLPHIQLQQLDHIRGEHEQRRLHLRSALFSIP